ncbi:MAG: B12-binding domain-containing radical SAM protein [Actinobacteria bacterium]|nr:B12-binding domain-containing radical SAM protein [Actinomycetota bacterium]
MKVVFVEPPPGSKQVPERLAGCSYELYHFPDLANLYLFTMLLEDGIDVDYIDSVFEELSRDQFLKKVENFQPDFIIVHSVLLSKKIDINYLKEISNLLPGAKMIVHGPEPTRVPEQYLVNDRTYVFRGSIEKSIHEFITSGKLHGVTYLKDGEKVEVPGGEEMSFDGLPIPRRDHPIFSPYINRYFNPKFKSRPFTIMMASRGCAFKCRFCVPLSMNFAREIEYKRTFGKKPKPDIASAQRVINEFSKIKDQGFRSVMVMDDQFLWSRDRTLEICNGIKGLGLEWGCLSRADFLKDEDVIRALAGAGCVSIDIGVESLSQDVLNDISKGLYVEDVYDAIELLNKYDISPKLNIMFGTSILEDEKVIKDTVKKLKSMPVDNVMFSIATPFKGTEFYDYCKNEGYLIDDSDEINPLGKSMISYPQLSRERLEKLQRWAYRSFYLRPRFIFKRILRYRSPKEVFNDMKVAVKLLRG